MNFQVKFKELPFEDFIILNQSLLVCFYFINYFNNNKDENLKDYIFYS